VAEQVDQQLAGQGESISPSINPATGKFGYPIHHVETRAQWRAWLEVNHASTRGVWLCSWRPATGRPRCPYPGVVEEAICFGWIDSTVTSLDDERGLQLLTPRNPKSAWTRLNRQRVAAMEAAGLMTEAGRRTVTIAQQNGRWTIFDAVEDLIEPDELKVALDADPEARRGWDRFKPGARKVMLWWVISAVGADTRQRRIDEIVSKSAVGLRARS
jgi:uncharacterized protein YdeI (YjbR/CyaY-like superfamily)